MHTIEQSRSGHVVIGVDTHKHVHVAAVMDTIGGSAAAAAPRTDRQMVPMLDGRLLWARGRHGPE